jgi:hypothetical protein
MWWKGLPGFPKSTYEEFQHPTLTEEFQIQHQKSTPYNPHENGTVEAFTKILEHALTKVCNVSQDDWKFIIPTMCAHIGL